MCSTKHYPCVESRIRGRDWHNDKITLLQLETRFVIANVRNDVGRTGCGYDCFVVGLRLRKCDRRIWEQDPQGYKSAGSEVDFEEQ